MIPKIMLAFYGTVSATITIVSGLGCILAASGTIPILVTLAAIVALTASLPLPPTLTQTATMIIAPVKILTNRSNEVLSSGKG